MCKYYRFVLEILDSLTFSRTFNLEHLILLTESLPKEHICIKNCKYFKSSYHYKEHIQLLRNTENPISKSIC